LDDAVRGHSLPNESAACSQDSALWSGLRCAPTGTGSVRSQ
jgi:hypothetical protein